jgi:hypothetical protein
LCAKLVQSKLPISQSERAPQSAECREELLDQVGGGMCVNHRRRAPT